MQDFNDAEEQKERGTTSAIPPDSIVQVRMEIRPATGDKQVGSDPLLTISKSNNSNEYLNCEFTVCNGTFEGKKIWQNFVVVGNDQAVSISKRTLRAILESARNVKPADQSPNAVAARRVNGWSDFQGLIFMAKVDCEISNDKKYVNNNIKLVITPDKEEYDQCAAMGEIITSNPIPELPPPPGFGGNAGGPPKWAQPAQSTAAGAASPPAPAATPTSGAQTPGPAKPAWAK